MVEQFRILFDSIGVDWILWILIALSISSIAIMIERWIFFRQTTAPSAEIIRAMNKALENGDTAGAIQKLENSNSMESVVLIEVLNAKEQGVEAMEDLIIGAMAQERSRFDQRLSFLGTLGNNAPFVGLLGTVLGVISAFGDLESNITMKDNSQNEALMGSIAEALVATAVGLIVAIPAVIAYNAFKGAIKTRTSNTEALCHFALAKMRSKSDPSA